MLLSLRKLLERLRELRDVGGRLAKEEDVATVPVPVGVGCEHRKGLSEDQRHRSPGMLSDA